MELLSIHVCSTCEVELLVHVCICDKFYLVGCMLWCTYELVYGLVYVLDMGRGICHIVAPPCQKVIQPSELPSNIFIKFPPTKVFLKETQCAGGSVHCYVHCTSVCGCVEPLVCVWVGGWVGGCKFNLCWSCTNVCDTIKEVKIMHSFFK